MNDQEKALAAVILAAYHASTSPTAEGMADKVAAAVRAALAASGDTPILAVLPWCQPRTSQPETNWCDGHQRSLDDCRAERAALAASGDTPILAALREQFVASNPPAVVARIAVWRLLGGDDDTHPWRNPVDARCPIDGCPCGATSEDEHDTRDDESGMNTFDPALIDRLADALGPDPYAAIKDPEPLTERPCPCAECRALSWGPCSSLVTVDESCEECHQGFHEPHLCRARNGLAAEGCGFPYGHDDPHNPAAFPED